MYIQIVPIKMLTGLSASITFRILKLYNKFSAFCRKPYTVWFSSHKEILYGISLVPSIQVLTASRLTLHNELGIPHSCWMVMQIMYKTWMEGTHDKHKKKNIFLRDCWTKSDGVFGKMQIISYNSKILKHNVDWFIILKVIDDIFRINEPYFIFGLTNPISFSD